MSNTKRKALNLSLPESLIERLKTHAGVMAVPVSYYVQILVERDLEVARKADARRAGTR